jgi:hypothetical protein
MIKEIQMAKLEEKQQIDDTLNLDGDFEIEEKGLEAPEDIGDSSESEAIVTLNKSKDEAHGPKWDNEKIESRDNEEEKVDEQYITSN